jgi:hypothetical protein
MGVSGKRHVPATLRPVRRPRAHCTAGWVCLMAGLEGCEKFRSHRNSITAPSIPSRVSLYRLCYPDPGVFPSSAEVNSSILGGGGTFNVEQWIRHRPHCM